MYDKTHIQTHDVKFLRGGSLPVFSSDFGPFGVMICADRRWPETVRTLALKGARILFNPTYGMHDERNLHMMQIRSYESEVFIAFAHPGQSLVTGPRGEVICSNRKRSERFTLCEVDLSQVEALRSAPSGHLRDRRDDLYL
jgi:predicted amidohydrolase